MNIHIITTVIGAVFLIAFLLYYVIYIKSVPLTFIMVAIIVMVCVNLLEEVKKRNNNNNNS